MGAGIRIDRALAWLEADLGSASKARATLDSLPIATRWEGVPYYCTRDLARVTRREIAK